MLIPSYKLKAGLNYIQSINFLSGIEIVRPIPPKLAKFWKWVFPSADLDRVYIAFNHKIYTNQDRITEDLVIHERKHLRQHNVCGRKFGGWIWLFYYLISKKMRYQFEIWAYEEQVKYLRTTGVLNLETLNDIAKVLSSPMYQTRWERMPMVSYENAFSDLQYKL